MNKETTDLIQKLADKLGTTAEHLWGVLLKQAPISAITEGVLMIILFTSLCSFWIWYGSWYKKALAKEIKKGYSYVDADSTTPKIVGLTLATLVFILVFLLSIGGVIAGLMNPEYWALMQIIGGR